MTYEYARETAGDTGLKLIEMLDVWRRNRDGIVYGNTKKGFNIDLKMKTEDKVITVLVFWGQLDQHKSRLMMSRQDKYPPFANIHEEDRKQLKDIFLRYNLFKPTSGNHGNVRLDYDGLPQTSLKDIIDTIDEAVNHIKTRCGNC